MDARKRAKSPRARLKKSPRFEKWFALAARHAQIEREARLKLGKKVLPALEILINRGAQVAEQGDVGDAEGRLCASALPLHVVAQALVPDRRSLAREVPRVLAEKPDKAEALRLARLLLVPVRRGLASPAHERFVALCAALRRFSEALAGERLDSETRDVVMKLIQGFAGGLTYFLGISSPRKRKNEVIDVRTRLAHRLVADAVFPGYKAGSSQRAAARAVVAELYPELSGRGLQTRIDAIRKHL